MFRTQAAVLLAPLLAGCGGESAARPDVLVVLVDTLRADRLPFYGYPADTAPFLTSWAERSVVFERAWATSSWTAPATASVFTGVYPDQHGVELGMQVFERVHRLDPELPLNRLPDELETLPELLRALGYRTFCVADNPNIGKEIGFDRGFDRFECFPEEGCEKVAAKVREWSAEIRASEPWFVYLHFMDPHVPYRRHAPYYRAPSGDDPIALDSAAYDSEIRFLDGALERVFADLGVGADTLVVFLSDHGEEFGDHGGRYHDPKLYSELTHVPFFVHVPGVPQRRERAPVSQVDLLPTLRDLLRAPPSDHYAGVSLRALLERREPLGERTLFGMRLDRASTLRCAIAGDRKYIVRDFDARLEQTPVRELYDLERDPREKTNLLERELELGAELDSRLRAREANARKWAAGAQTYEVSPQMLRKLQELGYAGEDSQPSGKHETPRDTDGG
jgi:arylsulfatase A-like enzyme